MRKRSLISPSLTNGNGNTEYPVLFGYEGSDFADMTSEIPEGGYEIAIFADGTVYDHIVEGTGVPAWSTIPKSVVQGAGG